MNQNSTANGLNHSDVPHSKPIPISTEHLRHRSASISSDSSGSPNSPPLVTPPKNFPSTQIPLSSGSPIFYFLSQSPTKPPATFPFRGFAPPPLVEDEPADDFKILPHPRRASTTSRFQPPASALEPHHERGVNVLRRLSLSQRTKPPVADISQPGVPSPPPNSAVSPPPASNGIASNPKHRRAATVSGSRARRAPSPMGERILKGHFDGFN